MDETHVSSWKLQGLVTLSISLRGSRVAISRQIEGNDCEGFQIKSLVLIQEVSCTCAHGSRDEENDMESMSTGLTVDIEPIDMDFLTDNVLLTIHCCITRDSRCYPLTFYV